MRKFILVSTLVLSSSVAFAQFTGPSVERDFEPRQDRMGQIQDRSGVHNFDDQRMNRQHRQQMNQQNHPRGEHRQYHNNGPRHGQYTRAHYRNGGMKPHSGNRQKMHSQRHSGPRHQMHQRQDCPYNN